MKVFVIVFIVGVVVLIALGGIGVFGFISYKDAQTELAETIDNLPIFDKAEAEKKIAKDLDLKYPIEKPTESLADIDLKVQRKLQERMKSLSKEYSENLMKAANKIKSFPIGKEVKIQLIDYTVVKGKYFGTTTTPNGVAVKIGSKNYMKRKIMKEFKILFEKEKCNELNQKAVSFVKQEFDKKKDSLKLLIEKLYYSQAGYAYSDGQWYDGSSVIEEAVKEEQIKFEQNRENKIDELIKNAKLFNYFSVEYDENIKQNSNTEDLTTKLLDFIPKNIKTQDDSK